MAEGGLRGANKRVIRDKVESIWQETSVKCRGKIKDCGILYGEA